MKKVLIRGPALSQSGYGEHTRFVLRALKSRPDLFDIYLVTTNWGQTGWIWEQNEEREWIDFLLQKTIQYGQGGGQFDLSLQVTIPNEWERIAPVNIGVTAGIETTKIAPIWVEKSSLMNKIIVVSEHAKFGFENTEYGAKHPETGQEFIAKVMCPIDVVGYPVKEIEPAEIELDLRDDFNFLTVGTWIPRKNLENTIKWFVEEFYDQEIGLVVKTSLAKNSLRDREIAHMRLKDLLNEYEDRKCKVYLLHGDLSESEMTALYQNSKIKALVNIGHGEGFGLPMFEAAYSALPVISPAWGGQCDFLYMPVKDKKGKIKNTPMFTTVAYDLRQVQKEAHWEGVIQADSQWCFVKEWAYKKALRGVVKSYGTSKSLAKKLQKHVEEKFNSLSVYGHMVNAVSPQPKLEDADYVFVSDFFADEVTGGAELSLEALIDKCPGSFVKIKSSDLSTVQIEHYKEKQWIFGNAVFLNKEIINTLKSLDLRYSIIEFDYKYCKYRNPDVHQLIGEGACNCVETVHGEIIKPFFTGAAKIFFMSEHQRQDSVKTLQLDKDRTLVLSSVFSDDTLNYISSLRQKTSLKRESWIVSDSPQPIKGSAKAKEWCVNNNKEFEAIHGIEYKKMLEKLSQSQGLCFLPEGPDTCPRLTIEAKLLGCELELNNKVLHKEEKWFDTQDIKSIESYLRNVPNVFWEEIRA